MALKYSDFLEDDGAIKALLDQLEKSNAEATKMKETLKDVAEELQKGFKKGGVATSGARVNMEKMADQTDKVYKEVLKYNATLDDNAVKVAAVKNATRTMNQVRKLEAKLTTEAEGSYNRLSAEYSLNKIRLNQMSKAQRENTKEGKKMVKVTNEIYQEMKRLQEETGKHTLSVGDYGKALEGLSGPFGNAISGIKGMGQQLKVLSRNPIVLVLGLIAGALAALFQGFKRSEKGAEFFARATGFINAVMSQLVNIAVKAVEAVEAIFKNPKESIKSFGKFLAEQVMNRFEAMIELTGALGRAIGKLFKGDFKGLKEEGQAALDAIAKGFTGLDKAQMEEISDAIAKVTVEVIRETNAFIDLESQKRRTIKANRLLVKSIEQLSTKEQVLNTIADDATKSFKERETAAEGARKALEQRAAKEIELARNNLAILNTEIELRRNNGEVVEALLDQQLAAYQAFIAAEREYSVAVAGNEKTRAELKQDRLERDLDILIDGFDNQKTINERMLADESLTHNERLKILQDTQRLADESFKKQIETIEQFTGTAIDANDLINESDAVALNKKIRGLSVSEIIEGRVLEIIKERKLATADLAEAEKKLAKARAEAYKKQILNFGKFVERLTEQEMERFDMQQELAQLEFNLTEHTEAEKTKFILNAEKERWKKILELGIMNGKVLSALQIEIIKAQIANIDKLISSSPTGGRSIFDLLGFNLSDEQEEGVRQTFSIINQQLADFAARNTQLTQQLVGQADARVNAANQALLAEIEAAKAGLAAKVGSARDELDNAKKNQKEALRANRRAQREQLIIDSLSQTSSLVTAAANIWKQLSFPAALPAIALMFASFAASKIRAFNLTKKQASKGSFDILGGGSHLSGNDTFLGITGNSALYGQSGEASMVLNRRATRKIGKKNLEQVFNTLNKGHLYESFSQNMIEQQVAKASGIPLIVTGGGMDTKPLEKKLDLLIEQGSGPKWFVGPNGERIKVHGNHTTFYKR